MQNRCACVIPELFPQPKRISLTGGDSTLSLALRLEIDPVLSSLREVISSILTAAGGQLSERESDCPVRIRLHFGASSAMTDVPTGVQGEYYELRVQEREVMLFAPSKEGILRGVQTLKDLFRRLRQGKAVPCMSICDWPAMPDRGIFVECKWGPDRMTLQDWCRTVDSIAGVKMNRLGIGIYGCWAGCRFEGASRLSEFLMVPVKGHEELDKQHHLRWFSPVGNAWETLSYREILREQDLLGRIVSYARERGVAVVPVVNTLGHNTLIPRLIPEISAKDADGNPAMYGYCLSCPRTKQFMEDLLTSIIDRYFPQGSPYFHVQLDEIGKAHPSPTDHGKVASPWCQCPECRRKTPREQLADYIIWIAKVLIRKGVGKVVMWNDMLTGPMALLTPEFLARLEGEGLKDRLILDCWDYDNGKLDPLRSPEHARKANLGSWVTPMTCYYDWSHYNYCIPNIDLMMKLGFAEGSSGVLSYSVHNPSHLDHEAALAGYAWEGAENTDADACASRWAEAHFAGRGARLQEGIALLRKIVASLDWEYTGSYFYTYCSKKWPRFYPQEALERQEGLPDDPVSSLKEKSRLALQADAVFASLLAEKALGREEKDCVRSLRAEASRIHYYAEAFAWLLGLRRELAGGASVTPAHVSECSRLREELRASMAAVEANIPAWLMPSALALMTPLYEYFGELAQQLAGIMDGSRTSGIDWSVKDFCSDRR